MDMNAIRGAFALLLIGSLAGCSSIRSTLVEWDQYQNRWATKKADGYPITLRVPTHMRVDVVDSRFMVRHASGDGVTDIVRLTQGKILTRRNINTQILYTSQVFLVDMKRPAAGRLNYGVNFTPDQYISQVQSREADDTIQQSSAAFVRIANSLAGQRTNEASLGLDPSLSVLQGNEINQTSLGTPATDARPDNPAPVTSALTPMEQIGAVNVKETPTVIASETFDLDDPEFEWKVAAFTQKWLKPE